jgi:COP9 signalosome complex subunit 6
MSHLSGMHNAIKMLHLRIKLLIKLLEGMKTGKYPVNHAIVRRINSLYNLLPTIDSTAFKQDFLNVHTLNTPLYFLSVLHVCVCVLIKVTHTYQSSFLFVDSGIQ